MYLSDNSLIKIAIAEYHTLFREAICSVINGWEQCKVVLQAGNGRQLLERLNEKDLPNIVITELEMPEMNGYDTIKALHKKFPEIKILVVSQYQSEEMLAMLIQYGAHGFVHKTDETTYLKVAVKALLQKGYYFTHHAASRMLKKTVGNGSAEITGTLNNEQLCILQHLCKGLTYKEIAGKMNVTERHIEYVRQQLSDYLDEPCTTKLIIKALHKGIAV